MLKNSMSSAAGTGLQPAPIVNAVCIEDFYRKLWHCDVKKDHGKSYDRDIVNSLLPVHLTQAVAVPSKESLFNSIVTGFRSELDTGICQVPCINASYTYKVFPINTQENVREVASSINAFLGDLEVIKITDTTRHGAELLVHLSNVKQAHTREVEYDAAGKMNPDSLSGNDKNTFKSKFYIELPGGGVNPKGLQYIPYTSSNQLGTISEFYTNKDIILHNNGVKDASKGTLNVSFDYANEKGGRTTVIEKSNIAKVLLRAKEFLHSIFGGLPEATRKEMVFLSKHHGDIGQVLTRYRDIELTPFNNITTANTTGNIRSTKYSIAFESYDLNAISKAFAVGTDIIWFHPPSDGDDEEDSEDQTTKKIIIFKREYNISIEERLHRLYEKAERQLAEIQETFKTLKANIETLNSRKTAFNAKWQEFVRQALSPEQAEKEKYIEVLKKGIQFSELSRYLPKGNITDVSDLQYLTTNIFTDDTQRMLKDVGLEKDIIIECSYVSSTVRLLRDPRVDDCWSLLDFDEDGKTPAKRRRVLSAFTGSTFLRSWAFELVYHIYNTFSTYNHDFAKQFITKLYSTLDPSHQASFTYGLQLKGIEFSKQSGGTYSTTYKRKNKRSRKYSKTFRKQKGGSNEITVNVLHDILQYFNVIHDIIQGRGLTSYSKYLGKYASEVPVSGEEDSGVELGSNKVSNLDTNLDTIPYTMFVTSFSIFPIYVELIDSMITNSKLSKEGIQDTLTSIQERVTAIYEYDTTDLTHEYVENNNNLEQELVNYNASEEEGRDISNRGQKEEDSIEEEVNSYESLPKRFKVGSPSEEQLIRPQAVPGSLATASLPSGSLPSWSLPSGSLPSGSASEQGISSNSEESVGAPKPIAVLGSTQTAFTSNPTRGGYRNAKTYKKKNRSKNESAKRRKSM